MADGNYPEDLLYTKEHEWCRIAGDVATIGITWHAQDQLGDIVFCELPEVGRKLSAGDTFGVVESTKTVSDLYAPLSGEVLERNEALAKAPEDINVAPYGQGWMIKIKVANKAEIQKLLAPGAYLALLKA